jgi:hypothetical protein
MEFYAGARHAVHEMQKMLNKLLEQVAVYESETLDDMAKAMEAQEVSDERIRQPD